MKKPIPVEKAKVVKLLPETGGSHPFGGAKHQVRPMDLSKYGYVEEEYLIAGNAKIYTWPEGAEAAWAEREGASYASRFLIRKPADSSKFSGNVFVEMFNWARGYDRAICTWGNCHEYLMREGDVWVGVSIRANVIDNLKRFDPVRYEALTYENPVPKEHRADRPQSNTYHDDYTDPDRENGLTWDMYSQVALALRDTGEGSPLCGYEVKAVIGTGATAGDLATYVAAIDPVSCRSDGGNLFDGYLIFMTGAPGNVNQYEEKLHWMDPRAKFYCKVPLIRAYTCKDMLGSGHHPDWAYMQRRNDSDEEGRYYRSYEIAGTGLMLKYTYFTEPSHEDVERCGLQIKNGRTGKAWSKEDLEIYEFPTRYALNAMHDNLKKWIRERTAPPSCEPYETKGVYPDTDLKEDQYGNVKGGVRLPYLRVPAYHFKRNATAVLMDSGTLSRLYAGHEDYVEKVKGAVKECIEERILLPEDGETIIQEAAQAQIP
ncbi:MAG: hypothetical protein HFG70_13475 [Hungatella sp.]|nr:hypothetical protein [Hungatella sp.]